MFGRKLTAAWIIAVNAIVYKTLPDMNWIEAGTVALVLVVAAILAPLLLMAVL